MYSSLLIIHHYLLYICDSSLLIMSAKDKKSEVFSYF